MRRLASTIFLGAVLVITGCVSRDAMMVDTTSRAPTDNVDIFKDGQKPEKPYKVIGYLTQLGPRQEELFALKSFVKEAKKRGAEGLIFEVPATGDVKSDLIFGQNGGLGGSKTEYTFKCNLIAYE